MIPHPAIANGSRLRRTVELSISEADAGFVAAVATRWARRSHEAAKWVAEEDPEMAQVVYDAAYRRLKSIVRREIGADNDAKGVDAALQLCCAVFRSRIVLSGGSW